MGKFRRRWSDWETQKGTKCALDANLDTHLGYLSSGVLTLRVSEFGFPEKMLHNHNFVAAAVLSTLNPAKGS